MRTQREILDSYDKYYEMIWRICLVQFGNIHDAYDATQETFIRLMNYTKSFRSEEHEKAWLIRVAVNYCKDVMKSSRRKMEIGLESGEAWEAGIIPDEYSAVYETMMELPKEYRVVLYLYYYEGYSLKEIAGMLKMNSSTLRSRFAKAKELMRGCLQEEGRCEESWECLPTTCR